jgi:putative RNA 2'-phosphotransferase
MPSDTELSKALSHALRHEPWLYELELDDEGWAPLEAVLAALRGQRAEWRTLLRADIVNLIESSEKRRHEVVGERVRALYGHSVAGKLRRVPATPPATLFHGTSPAAANVICRDGLKPMSRQYVHLSVDTRTAHQVGLRKSKTPVLLAVDAGAACASGIPFYAGNDLVWLADFVPARFVRLVSS